MLFLNTSATTRVILTLTEKVTLTATSVYFLFQITSDDNREKFYFTGPDLSVNKVRYNEFNITLTGSAFVNLTGGTIHLKTPGYYHYSVYQQLSQTNLSLTGVTGEAIEYGKILLSGASLNNITKEYTGATSLYVYN